MIKTPSFWREAGWQSRLLAPVAAVYGAISGRRMRLPPRHAARVPVIAIGNFTAGGAGKTPTAIAVARIATSLGFSPVIVMRGYGGTRTGPSLVEVATDTAREVGDEALMIALTGIPVVVARDRAAGADFAISTGGDLVVLDDCFQSPALAKDLSLVVVDGGYGIGNGRVMPAGPLRVPIAVQMAKADAVIVIGTGVNAEGAADIATRARAASVPVLKARLQADVNALVLDEREIIAFAGIGRPEKLAEGLAARGARIRELVAFPDHHPYTEADARSLLARVNGGNVRLVTTAKDKARLMSARTPELSRLATRIEVEAVELVFSDVAGIIALIEARCGGKSRKSLRP